MVLGFSINECTHPANCTENSDTFPQSHIDKFYSALSLSLSLSYPDVRIDAWTLVSPVFDRPLYPSPPSPPSPSSISAKKQNQSVRESTYFDGGNVSAADRNLSSLVHGGGKG